MMPLYGNAFLAPLSRTTKDSYIAPGSLQRLRKNMY
jgi:hypothetical protein